MGQAGTGGSGFNFGTYYNAGGLEYPAKQKITYAATAPTDGLLIASISNTTNNAESDGHGTSTSTIKVNGNIVSDSSSSYPSNAAEKRVFGSCASAVIYVKAGQKIVIETQNSANHSTYAITTAFSAGYLDVAEVK